ncbi:ribonuclease III [Corynebacterium amycolatum]|uniref:ribonuclease III n=1 Tax=Corynebacterium amycolatum TaxID=43765 RepID=UPI00211A8695|nr:ribonuclease III [Corynebacterium amycolatum]MCQ9125796.1 ribonuclease III [Corynebacterium amycolatum]MCQ9128802.1 ribonuclease III [Corynebacterium amycolatum]MCQ9142544.1 ribonuclease III [Corynebacterium amycolatum]MCQ9169859.1 ribonuclease III [Corynebacterium amycolatum]MCQ9176217.1 ribonuclease III [Corynebacterium amycolatum]
MSRKRRLTGEVARKAAFEAVDHAPLLEKLGVELPEESLKLALTHRSFANENGMLTNNERLEFLGDAVLGMCVAEELYRRFPDRAEQDISKMRAGVVNMYALADLARSIGLGEHILLGRGEKATGGADKHSILADTTEALLGAIYLQHGFEVARETVLRLFNQMIDDAPTESRGRDWKTLLQERLAAKQLRAAEYTVRTTGPDHDLTFYVDVLVDGVVKGSGTGATKKEAEMHAAHQAHTALA